MQEIKRHMKKQEIELFCVIESMLSTEKQKEIRKQFAEYDVFLSQRKQKKNAGQNRERGGILCIAKKGCAKQDEKKLESDDLICLNWSDLCLLCSFLFYLRANEREKNDRTTTPGLRKRESRDCE